jgi:hypothetical protein
MISDSDGSEGFCRAGYARHEPLLAAYGGHSPPYKNSDNAGAA